MYVYFHLVHVIITSNVGIILDVQFIVMSTKKVLENSIEGLLPELLYVKICGYFSKQNIS